MGLIGAQGEAARVPAHFGQTGQMRPPIEGRVLHTLGGHSPAHLLEADDCLGTQRGGGQALGPDRLAEQDRDDHVESLALVGLEPQTRPFGVRVQHRRLLGIGGLPRADVGSVALRGDEQLDHAGAQVPPRVIAQTHILNGELVQNVRQAVDLRRQRPVDDFPLGLLDDVLVGDRRLPGQLVHESAESRGPPGVDLQLVDAPGGVVPRGAGDMPGDRQGLIRGEDLLRGDPGSVSGLRQVVEITGGIGQAIGVVDPQGVDHPHAQRIQD